MYFHVNNYKNLRKYPLTSVKGKGIFQDMREYYKIMEKPFASSAIDTEFGMIFALSLSLS
jgi:hypothetical protein